MTNEYAAALTENNDAYIIYTAAVTAFRARILDEANFFLAQDAWKSASAKFDVAFESESNREEETVATVVDAPSLQMSLYD